MSKLLQVACYNPPWFEAGNIIMNVLFYLVNLFFSKDLVTWLYFGGKNEYPGLVFIDQVLFLWSWSSSFSIAFAYYVVLGSCIARA